MPVASLYNLDLCLKPAAAASSCSPASSSLLLPSPFSRRVQLSPSTPSQRKRHQPPSIARSAPTWPSSPTTNSTAAAPPPATSISPPSSPPRSSSPSASNPAATTAPTSRKLALPDPLPPQIQQRVAKFQDTPRKETWNAIAILRGSDPKLKDEVILLTAHLDHLGVAAATANGDSIYNGADDDASGTTAVLTLAHVLATGPRPNRTIVFALFGSEELGGFGARAFLANPPVPLNTIVANLEFEMIGRPDPAVPAGTLWLTGYERSTLGPELAKHGAHLVQDPHPKEQFFQRSDNITLARTGHHRPHRLQLRPPHRLPPALRRTEDHQLHPHG